MNNPLVSIIVPCYNQGSFLAETLDSVLAQTYKNLECIIINDGSTDNTEQVALHYTQKDSRFKYIYQQNQGVSAARNNAIRSSHGEFILPLDGDDLIAPTYLEKAVVAFIQHPELKIVYCKARYFGLLDTPLPIRDYTYERMIYENCFFVTCMCKRLDYDMTSGYNENMKNGWEDWDFLLYLLKPEDKIYRINEELFFYRIHTFSRNRDAFSYHNQLYKQILENHPDIYNSRYSAMFQAMIKENIDEIKQELNNIRQSRAYRIGKCILKPISFLK